MCFIIIIIACWSVITYVSLLFVFNTVCYGGFRRFLIHGNLCCFMYTICSAWFLDIRILTCLCTGKSKCQLYSHRFKTLILHCTLGTVLAQLNCHVYCGFILVSGLMPGTCLLVTIGWLLLAITIITSYLIVLKYKVLQLQLCVKRGA